MAGGHHDDVWGDESGEEPSEQQVGGDSGALQREWDRRREELWKVRGWRQTLTRDARHARSGEGGDSARSGQQQRLVVVEMKEKAVAKE
mmetsp:Transcript_3027/g.5484  ORF Transcript_3027/g.5484 Transcript_3027/m.5484 type:complete len:89 (+) Transcript_3027:252-518(+)